MTCLSIARLCESQDTAAVIDHMIIVCRFDDSCSCILKLAEATVVKHHIQPIYGSEQLEAAAPA